MYATYEKQWWHTIKNGMWNPNIQIVGIDMFPIAVEYFSSIEKRKKNRKNTPR